MRKPIDLEAVEILINELNLKFKNRKRPLIYRRAAVFKWMYRNGLSYPRIGQMFNKNHATIINAVKLATNCEKYEDYKFQTGAIINALETVGFKQIVVIERKLNSYEIEVLKCENMKDLDLLQETILNR